MADDIIPQHPSDPIVEVPEEPAPTVENPEPKPAPPRRRVYEPTLFPERKHKRVPPLIVIPSLFVIFIALFWYFITAPRQLRHVNTSGKIVYASDFGSPGISHLWIANTDGTDAKQLTLGSASDTVPVFSSEGSQVAFISNRAGNIDQVFMVDADGQNIVQVTRSTGAKSMPQFAPSGSLLGYTVAGILAVADVKSFSNTLILPGGAVKSTTNNTDDTTNSSANAVVKSFVWSSAKDISEQGAAAVEEINGLQNIAILPQMDKAPIVNIDDKPNAPQIMTADAVSLAWSPTQNSIAAAGLNIQDPRGAVSGIALVDSTGHLIKPLRSTVVTSATLGPQNPVFSPDGTQLVYQKVSQSDLAHRNILELDKVLIDDTIPAQLLYKGAAENQEFTPDGKYIVFLLSRGNNQHDLYRMAADGTDAHRISDGKADINSIAVSPQQPKS